MPDSVGHRTDHVDPWNEGLSPRAASVPPGILRDAPPGADPTRVPGGERGQATQLGKRVGEVGPWGSTMETLTLSLSPWNEEEVGTHPAPVALSVLVGDRKGIA